MFQVKKFRKERGWSQKKLSEVSGIPQSTISMIEQGKIPDPGISAMKKLAIALSVSLDELSKDDGV